MSAVDAPQRSLLQERYTAEHGSVVLSGVQALVRLTIDQRRLDRSRGHDTRVYVSGYQGSPLGGVDREMQRVHRLLGDAGVVFRPGLNEELAATAVGGTQLLGSLPRRRCEGVTGFWYGKNPGLDRAADAIRHANISGTAPLGGAVAWVGDDPASKSSTVPSSCEPMARSLLVPVLAPGSVAELLSLGLHAVALSRHAGLWCALKIVADVADASASVQLDGLFESLPVLVPREPTPAPVMLAPTNLDAEEELMGARMQRALDYARAAALNRVVFEPRRPRIAVLAAGIAHQAVLRALEDLGLDAAAREDVGLRVVQLSMPWPLDAGEIRRMLAGVETVLVVEDKLAFVEPLVKDALYGIGQPPIVLGKRDRFGAPLLPARGALGADDVAVALGRVLGRAGLPETVVSRLDWMQRHRLDVAAAPQIAARTPTFCSGCPHNASTRAEPDQLVGVGIGCHTMVALQHDDRHGTLLGMPQMGGEGAQWFGIEPFTDDSHFTQNLGDGTFHHSGSLAIRAAVAAGVNITYKLLYNDAVAMTGGQTPVGQLMIPELTRWLALEGVRRVVITTPDPESYRGVTLDPSAQVRHRDSLVETQRELAAQPGVSVLIHDDRCATEERRLRARGELPTPSERIWINERVCEGCGDCGEKSSCMSVLPVATEFGRKTQVHQASCQQDLSCLKGDCPSFVIVTPGEQRGRPPVPELPLALVEPTMRVGDDVLIRMPGVGGTGVVTVAKIMQMAAHLDGRYTAGLDQTGLAQKGGPVVSDLRISSHPIDGQLRASAGAVDVLLGFDLLGAAGEDTLASADPQRTLAVVNVAEVATAAMVVDPSAAYPERARLDVRLRASTRDAEGLRLDAQALSERLFGDSLPANTLLLGAAYQHGCVPVDAAAIERAIELNGTAVGANLAAFRWGRAAAIDPAAVARALDGTAEAPAPLDRSSAARMAEAELSAELRRLLQVRVPELTAYQSRAHAREYLEDVLHVAEVVAQRTGEQGASVAEAYAAGLFKLMAYKDEYEVARLHLLHTERARVEREFGPGARVQIMLHPPLLRALGVKRKLRLGRPARPLFGMLRALRRLRGTPLDPFGRTAVRRLERSLAAEYRGLVARGLRCLDAGNVAQVAELAWLPDVIRGYEEIKLAGVARFRERASLLLAELEGAPCPSVTTNHDQRTHR